jgi:hypothetical protein
MSISVFCNDVVLTNIQKGNIKFGFHDRDGNNSPELRRNRILEKLIQKFPCQGIPKSFCFFLSKSKQS